MTPQEQQSSAKEFADYRKDERHRSLVAAKGAKS